ncbi:MAG: helicase HerA domain-containing protein [Thermoprotei archaeon]|nr:type IV secretory system conjugative DNA transfer family protein [TACK group archaeon]
MIPQNSYEIQSLPYALLDDEDRRTVENLFLRLIKEAGCLKIDAEAGSDGTRFTISSPLPLEDRLDALGLAWVRLGTSMPSPFAGSRARWVADLPAKVEDGFLAGAYEHEVSIAIELCTFDDKRRLDVLASLLKGQYDRDGRDAAYILSQAETEGTYVISLALIGDKGRMARWASTNGLKLSRVPCKLLIPGSTVAAFFPFSSVEVKETGGVPLGENAITGSPVLFDFFSHRNYNVLLLGPSGTGKSAAIKILAIRLTHMYPDMPAIILDPEGEYELVARATGMKLLELRESLTLPSRAVLQFSSEPKVASLALRLAWSSLREKAGPKVLIVDEGWLLLHDDQLGMLARQGRKQGLLFVVASQRPLDFLGSEPGAALLENSATKILMRQDESALPYLSQALRLGKREQDFLIHVPPPKAEGYSQALLVDEWRRLPIRIRPTAEERELI